MTGVLDQTFQPQPESVRVYDQLFQLYQRLHDVFGTKDYAENQFMVMKELLALRDAVRKRRAGGAA